MTYLVLAALTLGSAVHGAAPIYHAYHGDVELRDDSDRLVFKTSQYNTLERLLRTYPSIQLTEFPGDVFVIDRGLGSDDTTLKTLRAELEKRGIASEFLAPYRTVAKGTWLIAPKEIRFRFQSGMRPQAEEAIMKAMGIDNARVIRTGSLGTLYEAQAPSAQEAVNLADQLYQRPEIRWAHPNFYYQKKLYFTPNDPLFGDQWHHSLIGSTGAWELEQGRSDVIIAILDSGVDMTHPDLVGKLVSPRDTWGGDFDANPDPADAHGTACAGVAAAIGNNDEGVIGTCPGCTIMPIRILGETGGSFNADSDGFYWAFDNGAQILSNSWGFNDPSIFPANLEDAINEVANPDVGIGSTILFASGNEDLENPAEAVASHPQVIGVGATNYNDIVEGYSNYGNYLDLTAPAASVSTDIQDNGTSNCCGYSVGDYMYVFSGTSAATPVAAGVAGLVLSANPDLVPGSIYEVLTGSADKIGGVTYTEGHHVWYGYGRVNAYRAVQMALDGEVCTPSTEICDNGIDDDCDFLADGDDPNCTPDVTEVGAACTSNFQCGAVGTCLAEADYGYPDGYCTVGCDSICNGSDICVDAGRSNICMASCDTVDDCRDGYDCFDFGLAEKLCYPSCTVSGCEHAEETCNTFTGECEHDGPQQTGEVCETDLVCSDNGFCLPSEWGFAGGYCSNSCGTDSDCSADNVCLRLGYFRACMDTCTGVSDCRGGYTCSPTNSAGTEGVCYPRCTSSQHCDGQACNQYGLCGTEVPPGVAPIDTGSDDEACTCDITYACDEDCGHCDPECEEDKGCPGCTGIDAGMSLFLLALLGGLRRRRRKQVA